jgi:hypothetical protein
VRPLWFSRGRRSSIRCRRAAHRVGAGRTPGDRAENVTGSRLFILSVSGRTTIRWGICNADLGEEPCIDAVVTVSAVAVADLDDPGAQARLRGGHAGGTGRNSPTRCCTSIR